MPRRLPSLEESRLILARRRTRPPPRPPPAAGKSLTKFVKALEARFGQGPDPLRARWREIVGERLAARTEPVKVIRNRAGGPGALEVKVDGPAAALIQHQAPQILARVNLVLGQDAVARLRIVQGRVAAPVAPGVDARPRRLRNQPLDAAAEAELNQSLARAPDGPLKQSLLRLGRSVLRRETER